MPDAPHASDITRNRCLIVLTTLAAVAALYLGAEFLIPIAMALVLNALFRPVVRGLERLKVPTGMGAGIIVLALAGLIACLIWGISTPLKRWINEAPEHFATAEQKLRRFRAPIEKLSNAVSKAENVVHGPTSDPTTQSAPAPIQSPGRPFGIAQQVLGTTTQIIGGLAEVLFMLFLLLGSGGMFFHKLMNVLRRRNDQKIADEVLHEAEHVMLRYLVASTLINVCQGIFITIVMMLLGMPTPILWGCCTFIFEFVPYLGAACMIVLLASTSLATFDSFGQILLPPCAYLIMTTLQNSLVAPIAYGRQLRLNPVAVLLGVLFWWYVWGVAGAFLAVPISAMIKVFASKQEKLRPVCEFLSE